jgi:hypothetical protein
MSANIKASVDGTQAIIGVGGVDQMTVSNAGVVTANSFVGLNSSSVTATGTTTARTLANRFADVVNVKDFGAVGDGIADDFNAVNLALLSENTFVITSGEYNLNNRVLKQTTGQLSPSIPFIEQLQSSLSFLSQLNADEFGEFLPNYLRRTIQQRYIIGTDIPYDVADDDISADKGRNSTASAYVLRLLSRVAEIYPQQTAYINQLNEIAESLISFQNLDERTARFGGIRLALNNNTASTFSSAYAGLAFCSAYRVTKNPKYLSAAIRVGEFLKVTHNPNPRYSAIYGVTVVPSTPANNAWRGFLDEIREDDTIVITNSTWNLMACYFLKELNDLVPDPTYVSIYTQARDWMATGVTGFYDFWAVEYAGALPTKISNNWFGTGLTVKDGSWHRRGESVIAAGGNIRSDIVAGATLTTVTLDAGADPTDGFYNGMAIRITSGLSSGKGSVITAYNGATKVATLQYEFPSTVSPGDAYSIGLNVNTIGTDQMEYGIEALYETGYNLNLIKAAYDFLISLPNADTGAFGLAYDSRICWPGFFRINAGIYSGQSRAFGAHYDVQGVGPILKFKYNEYPDHFKESMKLYQEIDLVGTLVNQNFETIKGTDPSGLFQTATFGMGTVKGTVIMGLLEAMYG